MAMEVIKGVATTGLILGGVGYLAAEQFGPGDCGKAILGIGDNESLLAECTGWGVEKATLYLGDGPQVVGAEVINKELRLQFGDVELAMEYPRGENGKLSKVDYDGSIRSDQCLGCTDGTMFAQEDPFYVHFTPCTTLRDDYTQAEPQLLDRPVGEGAGLSSDQTQSTLQYDILFENSATPLVASGVLLKAAGIEPCAVRIPPQASDGSENKIRTSVEGSVNNGVRETFEYALYDLAIAKGAANACTDSFLDMESVSREIVNASYGPVIAANPQLRHLGLEDFEVELANQDTVSAHYMNKFEERVEFYKDLDRSLYGDSDEDKKPMDIKFSDNILKVVSCEEIEGMLISEGQQPSEAVQEN